jgi:hypothetical protein
LPRYKSQVNDIAFFHPITGESGVYLGTPNSHFHIYFESSVPQASSRESTAGSFLPLQGWLAEASAREKAGRLRESQNYGVLPARHCLSVQQGPAMFFFAFDIGTVPNVPIYLPYSGRSGWSWNFICICKPRFLLGCSAGEVLRKVSPGPPTSTRL